METRPFAPFSNALNRMASSFLVLMVAAGLSVAAPAAARAQVIDHLPGSVDAGRLNSDKLNKKIVPAPAPALTPATPEGKAAITQAPANAAEIKLTLKSVKYEGLTAYQTEDLADLSRDLVGKEITLADVYQLADAVTRRYRQDGYFLSRAFIPAQEIESGNVTIRVAEGYVRKVDMAAQAGAATSATVQKAIAELTATRPLTVQALERFHLLLTDLPGLENYQGTLAPFDGKPDVGVLLVYRPVGAAPLNTTFQIDNYGSRYLGPMQGTAAWSGRLIGAQTTSLSVRNSLPLDELNAVDVAQVIPLTLDSALAIHLGFTHATPGYELAPYDIVSKSADVGVDYTLKLIRQRQENLSVTAGIGGRHSESTILGSDLSTDDIRILRLMANYETTDNWMGNNRASVEFRQGLGILGSSQDGDADITRDGAEPWFSKIEFRYGRYQLLPAGFSLSFSVDGQLASGSLYSSEEFGFGGQDMGRAYDSSEITGDDGLAGAVELRYQDISPLESFVIQPYGFYDIGKVWNRNDDQEAEASASSTGLGLSLSHESGLSANVQAALPLTRDVQAPLYGSGRDDPQFSFRASYAVSLP